MAQEGVPGAGGSCRWLKAALQEAMALAQRDHNASERSERIQPVTKASRLLQQQIKARAPLQPAFAFHGRWMSRQEKQPARGLAASNNPFDVPRSRLVDHLSLQRQQLLSRVEQGVPVLGIEPLTASEDTTLPLGV